MSHPELNEPTEVLDAVWEGSFRIFGVDVKCFVLSDGRRIVDAEDFAALLESMQAPDNGADLGELADFNRWYFQGPQ